MGGAPRSGRSKAFRLDISYMHAPIDVGYALGCCVPRDDRGVSPHSLLFVGSCFAAAVGVLAFVRACVRADCTSGRPSLFSSSSFLVLPFYSPPRRRRRRRVPRSSPSTFLMPSRSEEQFHVAVKRSSLAHMRRTPQENVFREISVMVSEESVARQPPPPRSIPHVPKACAVGGPPLCA